MSNPAEGPASWNELIARLLRMPSSSPSQRPVYRVDIGRLMSAEARDLFVDAARHATETGSADLDTDHLLWAALHRDGMRDMLRRAGADPDTLLNSLERAAHPSGRSAEAPGQPRDMEGLTLTPATKRTLLQAHQISRANLSSYIGPEHILMALSGNPDSPAGRTLAEGHVAPDALRASRPTAPTAVPRPTGTSTLDEFGQDLTALARDGKLDPVVGREDEIETAVEILSRRTKNNPVLIGEAGVGKTAIVEGIAQRIVSGDVPLTLAGKRVMQLDLAGLVAGTRYRGDFEERLKRVIDEVRAHSEELIVFLDELHTLVGAGTSGGEGGGMDASNMLKPALARGELRVVGATTLNEYRQSIEKDAALARRFQPILVPEPTVDETVAILRGLRDGYEAHHNVRYTDEALVAAAELGDRYISDRFLPDKAIDLMDQAGARVRLKMASPAEGQRDIEERLESMQRDKEQAVADEQYERAREIRDEMASLRASLHAEHPETAQVPTVDIQAIAEVVSRGTGIPISQLTEEERSRLLRLEDVLHERVIGQHDAVAAVAEAVRRSRAGLGDPTRPVGSFLFLGPTGVGKTELARAMAQALFGDEDRMIRLDMSEFGERHTVARLVGAPPGYVGYGEAGQLTEQVRRHPYSVVLFDEIEKAHADIFNILLQVLDDGRLTDSQGRTVSFRNAVVIMTSNIGSELLNAAPHQQLGFGAPEVAPDVRDELMGRLHEHFRPEFLNRIDEIIIFNQLTTEELHEIAQLILEQTRHRLHAQDIGVSFTDGAIDLVAEKGFEPEFGARPMRRLIQHSIDNQLSNMILRDELNPGDEAQVDVEGEDLVFHVTTPQPS